MSDDNKATECPRCAANLVNGSCEYCGWNTKKGVPSKTLTLSGVLSKLVVTGDNCTFTPKVGATTVIANKEIVQISVSQAPLIGSGELSVTTVTGISQRITFLHPQNTVMGEIASYLLHVAPEARFTTVQPEDAQATSVGFTCPKCKSTATKKADNPRRFSIPMLLAGVLIVALGVSVNTGPVIVRILIIVGGASVIATGVGLKNRKKTEHVCNNCRKRFRV